MARVHRLTPAAADRLRDLDLTYSQVGGTLDGTVPEGFHGLRHEAVIGSGADDLAAAAEALLSWQVQARSGIRVRASSAVVEVGAVAELRLGPGPLAIRAPVRVVAVIEEADRRGFAYGTLPGHPESGEELFVVVRTPDGTVSLEIGAFSRPVTRLARLGGPVARLAQAAITRRYGRALRRL